MTTFLKRVLTKSSLSLRVTGLLLLSATLMLFCGAVNAVAKEIDDDAFQVMIDAGEDISTDDYDGGITLNLTNDYSDVNLSFVGTKPLTMTGSGSISEAYLSGFNGPVTIDSNFTFTASDWDYVIGTSSFTNNGTIKLMDGATSAFGAITSTGNFELDNDADLYFSPKSTSSSTISSTISGKITGDGYVNYESFNSGNFTFTLTNSESDYNTTYGSATLINAYPDDFETGDSITNVHLNIVLGADTKIDTESGNLTGPLGTGSVEITSGYDDDGNSIFPVISTTETTNARYIGNTFIVGDEDGVEFDTSNGPITIANVTADPDDVDVPVGTLVQSGNNTLTLESSLVADNTKVAGTLSLEGESNKLGVLESTSDNAKIESTGNVEIAGGSFNGVISAEGQDVAIRDEAFQLTAKSGSCGNLVTSAGTLNFQGFWTGNIEAEADSDSKINLTEDDTDHNPTSAKVTGNVDLTNGILNLALTMSEGSELKYSQLSSTGTVTLNSTGFNVTSHDLTKEFADNLADGWYTLVSADKIEYDGDLDSALYSEELTNAGWALALSSDKKSISLFKGDVPVEPEPVPEPSTWALLILGVAGLLWYRKRNEKR